VTECVLCRPRLETPILRESRLWRIAVNRNQSVLGKCIIVLRRHEEAVVRLTAEEWSELHREIGWITDRLHDAFEPDHFNYAFLQNLDRHVHLHVIPRYVKARTLAGRQFDDSDFPDGYRASPSDAEISGSDVIAAVEAALVTPSRE
jgi:diadenosine tetraphosphate (Ap4A) HIT family hydrolase